MKKTIYSSKQEKLTSWLKDARLKQGLSMRQLAEKLDCPHSFIGKVEQGERRLDVIEFIEYCMALKISPNEGIKLLT